MSFPGTSSFVGELLILVSCFSINPLLSFYAAFGMILNGIYVIWLFNRLFFGILSTLNFNFFSDINKREFVILLPLSILILIFGLYPNLLLDYIYFSVFYLNCWLN